MSRSIQEMSVETRLILQRLKSTQIGETVTYGELSQIAAKPVSGATGNLTTARRSLCNNERMVFEVVRTVGVKRLSDLELATTASDYDVLRTRRHAKRSAKRMMCVDTFAALPNHAQLAHTIKISFFGAIAWMAQKGRLEKASAAVGGRSGELPISETLRAFTD